MEKTCVKMSVFSGINVINGREKENMFDFILQAVALSCIITTQNECSCYWSAKTREVVVLGVDTIRNRHFVCRLDQRQWYTCER